MLTLWAPRLAAATERPSWLDDPALRESASTDQIRQFGEPFAGRTPQSVAGAREEWINLQKNVAVLGTAGVKLILGTDVGGNTGGPLGWTEHIELENMVAAELGTIAAGKRADFIVLDANPLADITNSRRISKVYQRGVELDRVALRAAWGKP